MSVALVVLLLGLLVAGISAAVGVAAATVSQHELTRWVAYKLRGSAATAGLLQNPGRTLATANTLTTLGVLLAAGAIPALLAATTATFLGVFTVAVGVPLFIGASYLVPRVLGRRGSFSRGGAACPPSPGARGRKWWGPPTPPPGGRPPRRRRPPPAPCCPCPPQRAPPI